MHAPVPPCGQSDPQQHTMLNCLAHSCKQISQLKRQLGMSTSISLLVFFPRRALLYLLCPISEALKGLLTELDMPHHNLFILRQLHGRDMG